MKPHTLRGHTVVVAGETEFPDDAQFLLFDPDPRPDKFVGKEVGAYTDRGKKLLRIGKVTAVDASTVTVEF